MTKKELEKKIKKQSDALELFCIAMILVILILMITALVGVWIGPIIGTFLGIILVGVAAFLIEIYTQYQEQRKDNSND